MARTEGGGERRAAAWLGTSSGLFCSAASSISLASSASVIQKHTSNLGFSGSCRPTMFVSPLSRQKVGTEFSFWMICSLVSALPGAAAGSFPLAFCSGGCCTFIFCVATFSAIAASSSASSSSFGRSAACFPLPARPIPGEISGQTSVGEAASETLAAS